MNERTSKVGKEIRKLDSRTSEGIMVDIPASGIEQKIINELPPNQPFWGKDPDGNVNQYTIINNKIYKAPSNYIEV